jgi:P-type Cu2+ transporter
MLANVPLPAPATGHLPAEPCAHCGLPLPTPPIEVDGHRFCCAGCSSVFAAIHGAGLGAFYAARDRAEGRRVRPAGRRFAELDDPSFSGGFETHPDGSVSTELRLEGVHCAACVWLVENLPRVVMGVSEARLDFGRQSAWVRWDPALTRLSTIGAGLDRLGYTPHAPGATGAAAPDRSLLMRLGVAGAIAGNVMLMAFALYSAGPNGMDREYVEFFRWGSLILSLPAIFYCAAIFYRGAAAALLVRRVNMDLPIALGISAGFASGAFNTWRGRGEIYFDTITTLIFLLLVGRWLGQRQQRRAAAAADFALALSPSTARILDAEGAREVPAASVAAGDVVEVRAGERIPIDGRVEAGASTLDVRLLTGESSPVEVRPGDRVYAGTENIAATLVVRTESAGPATRVGQLLRAMERAQRERAPIVRVADRIAGQFVLAILALAVLTLALWWRVDPALAVDHAVALLVVTCPCALGMATPLAVSVALARAARRGILVKNGEVLEALAEPADIFFDKSGTLTAGRPTLLEFDGPNDLADRVSVAEEGCDHPLARAFRAAYPPPPTLTATEIVRSTGAGVRARVAGHELLVGTPALLRASGIDVPESFQRRVDAVAAAGSTPVLVAENGQVAALAAFGDALRADAAPSLAALAELGASIEVLSGDHPGVVERVCRELPVRRFRGAVSPEQKLAEVNARIESGRRVIMVGDGLNDAAAMSAASVGFAVHGGAEASLLAAGVFSTEPGVAPVLEAIRGARQTLSAIKRGLGFSLAYNALGIALAMSGILSPLLAAIMMPLSSLTVLTSALHSRAFRAPRCAMQERIQS